MKRKTQQRVWFITLSAMIASLYVLLTLFSAIFGLSSGAIQVRISEALCVLTFLTPAAIPGLTIGCLVANIVTSATLFDIIFGTIATFLGALGGYYLKKRKKLITLPTVFANTLIIPFVIVYGFGAPEETLPFIAFTVFIGEFISATILGTILLNVLKKYNFKIK